MLETAPIIIQNVTGGIDWPAIAASISTGVAALAGIGGTIWQSKRGFSAQLRVAREQLIGERQIDTYLDMLEWTRKVERNIQVSNTLQVMEILTVPEKLQLNVTAFASNEVRRRMDEFSSAWLAMQTVMLDDESRIRELVWEAWKTKDFKSLFDAVPEWSSAHDAMTALRNSIRLDLGSSD